MKSNGVESDYVILFVFINFYHNDGQKNVF